MSENDRYVPELGQAWFGGPWEENAVPEYAEALFFAVWKQISRVFGNVNQREFDQRGAEDPKIPGFEVRPYWWGDEEAPEANLPNFVFGDVRIRWYKYPGRGMSTNVVWEPARWVEWFDAAMATVRAFEKTSEEARRAVRIQKSGFELNLAAVLDPTLIAKEEPK